MLNWFVYTLLHIRTMKQDVQLLTAGEYYSRLFAVNFNAPLAKGRLRIYTMCIVSKSRNNEHEMKTVSLMHVRGMLAKY